LYRRHHLVGIRLNVIQKKICYNCPDVARPVVISKIDRWRTKQKYLPETHAKPFN
jgi:hypothetical protein